MTTIEYELHIPDAPEDEEYIYVYFTARVVQDNDGIGSYEYAGIRGYDHGQDFLTVEDEITWDEDEHTPENNAYIKKWLDDYKNYETICNLIIAKAEKDRD